MVSSGERFVFASDFAFLSPIASGAAAPSRKCNGWYHCRRRRPAKRLWRALAGAEIGRGFGSRRPAHCPTGPGQVDMPGGIGDLFGENDNDAVGEFDWPAVPAGSEFAASLKAAGKVLSFFLSVKGYPPG
jgi:hypothetical protein